MLSQFYPFALRILGCFVTALSVLSGMLLLAAPPPEGLMKLDPQVLRTVAVAGLGLFGALLPLIMVFSNPAKLPLLKAGVFAAAGFANAMTLSPLLSVPLQDNLGFDCRSVRHGPRRAQPASLHGRGSGPETSE